MNKLISADITLNDDVLQGGVAFSHTVNPSTDLELGNASKSTIEFSVLDMDNTALTKIVPFMFSNTDTWQTLDGDLLEVHQAFEVVGTEFLWEQNDINKGYYTITNAERINDSKISFTAVDRMHLFDKMASEWYNELTYPISISNMLKSLCDFVGVSYLIQDNTNADFMVQKNVLVEDTTAREILGWILSAMANFAYFNSQGILIVDFYNPTNIVLTSNDYKTQTLLDYTVAKINKVQVKSTSDDIGIIVGLGTNGYVIEGNPLFFNNTDEMARPYITNIYNKLKDLEYVPASVDYFNDDVQVNIGDIISVQTRNDTINTLVMSVASTGSGFLQSISSTGSPNRKQLKSINHYIKVLNNKTNEIKATVDEFSVKLTEVEDGVAANTAQLQIQADQIQSTVQSVATVDGKVNQNTSQITQQAGQISQKVSSTDYNGNTIASLINQTATTIDIEASKINLTGYITATNLATQGQTVINGNNITTGQINSMKIVNDSVTIDENAINFTSTSGSILLKNDDVITFKTRSGGQYLSLGEYSSNAYGGTELLGRIMTIGGQSSAYPSDITVNGSMTIVGNLNIPDNRNLLILNGATLAVQSGADFVMQNGSNGYVQSGGHFYAQSGGEIIIQNNADFVVNSGGTLEIQSGANVYADGSRAYTGYFDYTKSSGGTGRVTIKEGIITSVT